MKFYEETKLKCNKRKKFEKKKFNIIKREIFYFFNKKTRCVRRNPQCENYST